MDLLAIDFSEWTPHSGDLMPEELRPDQWVEVVCSSGAVNTNLARNILWEAAVEHGRWAYWTVFAYRPLPLTAPNERK